MLLTSARSAHADRCSRQAQHAEQHLRRLPETRPPGAEVPGGQQAVPPQLLQVITAATVAPIYELVRASYSYS